MAMPLTVSVAVEFPVFKAADHQGPVRSSSVTKCRIGSFPGQLGAQISQRGYFARCQREVRRVARLPPELSSEA